MRIYSKDFLKFPGGNLKLVRFEGFLCPQVMELNSL
jgi:hypothetical protein